MTGVLAHLGAGQREELLDDLNYLNLQEIRSFYDHHGVPYRITAGTKVTQDTDRKPVILHRPLPLSISWGAGQAGQAPTFSELADAWVLAVDKPRQLLSDEYAFLTDLRRGEAGPGWKLKRQQKAGRFQSTIDRLPRDCRQMAGDYKPSYTRGGSQWRIFRAHQ